MQRQDRSFIITTPLSATQVQAPFAARLAPATADTRVTLQPALAALPIAVFVAALMADIVAWWMNDPFWAESAFRLTAFGAVITFLLSLRACLHSPTETLPTNWLTNLPQFSIPAVAIISLLVRFIDPVIGAVIPWGLVLSAVISIWLLTQD